jgi:hypothetical protein
MEALAQGIKRAGAHVVVDDAQRPEAERGEAVRPPAWLRQGLSAHRTTLRDPEVLGPLLVG